MILYLSSTYVVSYCLILTTLATSHLYIFEGNVTCEFNSWLSCLATMFFYEGQRKSKRWQYSWECLLNGVGIVERIKDTRTPFYRPQLPQHESEGVHPDMLMLMKQCWAEEPAERPLFKDVIKTLKIINSGKLEYCLLLLVCWNINRKKVKVIWKM